MAEAAFLRVAVRFKQWDMAWWEVYGSNKTTLDEAFTAWEACRDAAVRFRHPSVYISFVRVSNPFAQRQADIKHYDAPGNSSGNIVPAVTSTAAIYQFKGTTAGVKRSVWLRGLPDNVVSRRPATGVAYPNGTLDTNVKSYFDALRANGFGVPSVVPVDTGDNRRHPITSITVLPQQQVRINTPDVYVVGARSRVIIYKVNQKLFPALTGRFTITPAAGTFVLQGYLSPLPEDTYPQVGAAFRQEIYRFSGFAAGGAQFLNFDRRDTKGGPLDTRGRSRAAITRSS